MNRIHIIKAQQRDQPELWIFIMNYHVSVQFLVSYLYPYFHIILIKGRYRRKAYSLSRWGGICSTQLTRAPQFIKSSACISFLVQVTLTKSRLPYLVLPDQGVPVWSPQLCANISIRLWGYSRIYSTSEYDRTFIINMCLIFFKGIKQTALNSQTIR